jgi:hypothetical protein
MNPAPAGSARRGYGLYFLRIALCCGELPPHCPHIATLLNKRIYLGYYQGTRR